MGGAFKPRVTMSECVELQSTTCRSKHRVRARGIMVARNATGLLGQSHGMLSKMLVQFGVCDGLPSEQEQPYRDMR
jgi:hypothetical protein